MRSGAGVLFVAVLLEASPSSAGQPPPGAHATPPVPVLFDERATEAPVIAVCAAARRGLAAPSVEDARWTDARGGLLHDGPDPSIQCIELPSGELAFGLWVARRWVTGEPEIAARDARSRAWLRLADLASEGTAGAGGATHAALIVVAGKMSPEEQSALPAGRGLAAPRAEPALGPERQRSERLSVLEDAAIRSPELHVGYPIAGASEDDLARLGVIAALLGAGEASRLPSILVRRRGRATDARTWLDAPSGIPLFGISLAVSPHSSIDRVERYVEGALKQLRIAGPHPGELAAAKRVFENRLLHLVESPLGRAQLLARVALAGGPAVSVEGLVARARAASAESIRETTRRYLVTTRRSVVEVYPPDWTVDDIELEGFTLHTAAEGDTWENLAARFGVTAGAILRANELDPRFRPVPGEAIWIPPPARAR